MGFQDRDRGDEKHLLACKYLVQKSVSLRVMRMFEVESRKNTYFDYVHREWVHKPPTPLGQLPHHFKLEHPLRRGDRPDAFVVGFVDGVSWFGDEFDSYSRNFSYEGFNFEVKTTPVGVDEIAKQVSLYLTFLQSNNLPPHFLVATTFDLSRSDRAIIEASGAKHARLRGDFEAFCEQDRIQRACEAASQDGGDEV